MAGLAILRVGKLKSFGNVGGSEAHTARLQETTNADPEKTNIRLIGDNDHPLEEIVKTKIASSTKHKPRKNAVLCSNTVAKLRGFNGCRSIVNTTKRGKLGKNLG
jgi:hypothetical protein